MPRPSPAEIRAARAENTTARERDFATHHGITEADLLAAHVGRHDDTEITRIVAAPDRLLPPLAAFGDLMGLTRNDSCVIEKTGRYGGSDNRVALEIRPEHWVQGFAMAREVSGGTRHSLQVFDAAGDSVHKVFLMEGQDATGWAAMVAALALPEQSDALPPACPRPAPVAAPAIGRELPAGAAERLMKAAAEAGVPVSFRVGNRGCTGSFAGLIHKVVPYGPWMNVLDPGLELHLRSDHIAAVRADGETVRATGKDGALIIEMGGLAPGWADLLAAEG
ncbi:hypothetical protein CCR83_13830 [Rhodobacter veldkampii DSM 11550]|uniref:Haemin-degrading HemS/ChuX domain-containing protein n=1 Tax=Phaeovulum veldkampii DSM 11550 TaxID=1185920 RepID=A0A2T4JJ32_9RHOB|nr:ChuX/HutX family heme-like substrate-binding protein [Phaeovulum veldkampii]MBK5947495.1 hypothetical protein [Phaeovulum veldkampii DSM 11550]NCU19298.1 hypothetical protein [Candidatus Falkowbacteria bacterium]PTE17797.1 hypothetical protein C5F46_07090 [Phaeovulum veldkampii DSM 11550]TDQ63342.1 putative hemin transport protein [Phaeovulum veldkampii DSM 11550]